MYLNGKTAIITGVSKGLGRAFAEALLAEGVRVVGWGQTPPPYEAEGLHFVACDVRSAASVAEALEASLALSPRLDILINNAGLGRFGPVEEIEEETWEQIIGTNLSGLFRVTQALVPVMKRQGSGHIVNISSIAGRTAMALGGAYNASKFGVTGFSEALFHELRPFGIKVSAVFPGSVQTHFFDEIPSMPAHANMMRPEDVARSVVQLLDTHPNYVIREIEMRPLNSKPPKDA